MDNERYQEYIRSAKWRAIAKRRMEIDGFVCQMCGNMGTTGNALEVHHLTYKHLYHEENWIYQDLVCVCGACHRQLHRCMNRITNEDGRRGWQDNRYIPKLHVVDIGEEIEVLQDD